VVRGGGGGGGGGGTRRDTVRATEPDRLLVVVLGTAGGSALARAPQYGGGGGAPAGRRAARAAPSHLCSAVDARPPAGRHPRPSTDSRLPVGEAHGTQTKCAPPHLVVCFCFFFLVDWPLGNICSVSHLQRKHPLEFLNVFFGSREQDESRLCVARLFGCWRDAVIGRI